MCWRAKPEMFSLLQKKNGLGDPHDLDSILQVSSDLAAQSFHCCVVFIISLFF